MEQTQRQSLTFRKRQPREAGRDYFISLRWETFRTTKQPLSSLLCSPSWGGPCERHSLATPGRGLIPSLNPLWGGAACAGGSFDLNTQRNILWTNLGLFPHRCQPRRGNGPTQEPPALPFPAGSHAAPPPIADDHMRGPLGVTRAPPGGLTPPSGVSRAGRHHCALRSREPDAPHPRPTLGGSRPQL